MQLFCTSHHSYPFFRVDLGDENMIEKSDRISNLLKNDDETIPEIVSELSHSIKAALERYPQGKIIVTNPGVYELVGLLDRLRSEITEKAVTDAGAKSILSEITGSVQSGIVFEVRIVPKVAAGAVGKIRKNLEEPTAPEKIRNQPHIKKGSN